MNQLMNFNFNDNDMTVIKNGDQIWFRGFTVASILGYENQRKAIKDHVKDKYKTRYDKLCENFDVTIRYVAKIQKHSIFINEPGLYSLILRSKMPIADKFSDWVVEEVLPSIRKTGSYTVPKNDHDERRLKLAEDEERRRQDKERRRQVAALESITDAKLKQALTDRIMNELQGRKAIMDKTEKWARDIQTIAKEEYGETIDFMYASKLGTYIKNNFVKKYKRNPSKYNKFCNGCTRKVNAYEKQYEPEIIQWIGEYMEQ